VMLLGNIKYTALLALGVLALASAGSANEDKDKPSLSGTWVLKKGELKIEFSDKDVMKIYPHGENKMIVVVCEYTLDKKGQVNAKVTELEGEAKDRVKEMVPVGLKFTFNWKVKDNTVTLDELKGDNVEALKSHLEGDYEQKK
jgi:hypothetical protein